MAIEQPWDDHRIKLNGAYIGCVTKENADYLIGLERDAEAFRRLFAMLEHQVREELAIYQIFAPSAPSIALPLERSEEAWVEVRGADRGAVTQGDVAARYTA